MGNIISLINCKICPICYEYKSTFMKCTVSDKHNWCLNCHNLLIKKTCPICRTPFHEWTYYDSEDDFELEYRYI